MSKKEEILQAALELLIMNGVHATPMSAIAKAAGTGMGTIYNYFENKEFLINAIYVDIKQKEEKRFSGIKLNKPVKTQFEEYYLSSVHFFIANPLYFQFMQQLHPSPIISEESRNVGRNAIAAVYALLQKAQQERIIKGVEVEELMQFIGGTVTSYLNWHFRNSNGNSSVRMENQLKMVWDAIKE